MPLGIPGHSAVLWLGTMVAGRAIIRRDGAGLLIGASMALWGLPVGINNALVYNLSLYGFSGLALDIVAKLPKVSLSHPVGSVICCMLAHLVKFGYIFAGAYTSVTRHFLVFGLAKSAVLHLAFGAAAGLVGWGIYRVWQSSRKQNRPR